MKRIAPKPLFITILIVLAVGIGVVAYNRDYRRAQNQSDANPPATSTHSFDKTSSPSGATIQTPTTIPPSTIAPSPTTASKVNTTGNPSVRLESVTPSSIKDGDTIVLKGSGFGPNPGMVLLYNANGQTSGSMTPEGWSNTEIRTRMSWVSSGTFYISVKTSTFWESNKVQIAVVAGQPHIRSINDRTYAPFDLRRNSQVTITGTDFGSAQGSIDLIKGADTTNPYINSWSGTAVVFTVPATVVNTEYELWLKTADGRKTSLWYVNIVD